MCCFKCVVFVCGFCCCLCCCFCVVVVVVVCLRLFFVSEQVTKEEPVPFAMKECLSHNAEARREVLGLEVFRRVYIMPKCAVGVNVCLWGLCPEGDSGPPTHGRSCFYLLLFLTVATRIHLSEGSGPRMGGGWYEWSCLVLRRLIQVCLARVLVAVCIPPPPIPLQPCTSSA